MTESELTQAGLVNKPFEVKDMTGTLWMELQTKQGTNGDYEVRSGNAKINGVEYWISAYAKTTATGKELLNLTFKEKKPKAGTSAPVDASRIPF